MTYRRLSLIGVVLTVAALSAPAEAVQIGTTWSSYNAVIRDDGTDPSRTDAVGDIRADILGSDGLTNTNLRLYETQLNLFDAAFDISQSDPSTLTYAVGACNANEALQPPQWIGTTPYPYYAAKSAIARGLDDSSVAPGPRSPEYNGPLPPTVPGAPDEIYDLQTHVREHNMSTPDALMVAAFAVPEDGDYMIMNFATRRWSNAGSGTNYQSASRIYGPDGKWLGDPASAYFQAAGVAHLVTAGTNASQWEIDPNCYGFTDLHAGDEIYFAQHKNLFTSGGTWWYDGTEVTFDIMRVPEPCTLLLVGLGMAGLMRRRRGAPS